MISSFLSWARALRLVFLQLTHDDCISLPTSYLPNVFQKDVSATSHPPSSVPVWRFSRVVVRRQQLPPAYPSCRLCLLPFCVVRWTLPSSPYMVDQDGKMKRPRLAVWTRPFHVDLAAGRFHTYMPNCRLDLWIWCGGAWHDEQFCCYPSLFTNTTPSRFGRSALSLTRTLSRWAKDAVSCTSLHSGGGCSRRCIFLDFYRSLSYPYRCLPKPFPKDGYQTASLSPAPHPPPLRPTSSS